MYKLLLALSLLVTLQVNAQENITAKIDELLNAHTEINKFSGSVLVSKKGNIIYEKGFGYANIEHKVKNTPETKFLLASITKQFTSMAIMILVNEGKLKLDGKISDYLPYYRKDIGEKVTIHQLLVHTSGIPGYTELPGFFVNDSKLSYGVKEFVEKYCSNDLEFEPGTQHKYNNSAYFILGAIIEKVSGLTYAQFIEKNIFEKVGMYNSGYASNTKIIENNAQGYSGSNTELQNAQYLDMSVPYAAGGLYSTVKDMYLWDQVLYTDFLLPKKWRDTLFYNHSENYGYAWAVGKVYNHNWVHHSGGIHGFSTHIARFIDDEICIITLGNTDFNAATSINIEIAAILFDEKYEIPRKRTAIKVDEKILQKYKGTYEMTKDFHLEVSIENGELAVEATGQPKFVMSAESEVDFFLDIYQVSLTFQLDDKGKVTGMILHQRGDHELKKIK